MKFKNELKRVLTRTAIVTLLISTFFSCENDRFNRDKRQIMAKDEIENKLVRVKNFDITGFHEDTIYHAEDTNFKKQIRYTLNIVYVDSNQVFQEKKGIVLFTLDGKSIINSQITGR